MRIGVLLLLTALLSQPSAAVVERTSVAGSIRGYFMSPEGALSVREFAVGAPAQSPDAPSLHPLWSQYYLAVAVASPRPVSRIRLVAEADGAVLYDHPFDPPVREVHLPPGTAAGLGAHAKHGLSWRLELAEESGGTETLALGPTGVHLLPMPPLKINWLDLLRIGQVRSLLRACGDAILPGLRADDVPFLLLGDEGQGVLVDHPNADAPDQHYIGPSPLQARLQVGDVTGRFPRGMTFSAAALDHMGRHTVVLPYDDIWWAHPEPEKVAGSTADVWERLRTLAHEACHVMWEGKCAETGVRMGAESLLPVPTLEARALAEAERQALADAAEAPAEERPRLVREFLALREERAAVSEPTAALVSALEPQETDEGLAWHVSWRLTGAAREAGLSADGQPSGPFGIWYSGPEPTASVKAWLSWDPALSWHPLATVTIGSTIYGATEALVLNALAPEALTRIWTEGKGNLREALAVASGYNDLSPEARAELRRSVRAARGCDERAEAIRSEATQKGRKLRRELRETGSGDTVALSAEVQLYGEPERTFRSANEAPWEYLERFGMSLPDGQLYVDQPCLVRVSVGNTRGTAEVRTVLGDTNTLLHVTQEDDLLGIETKDVVLEARSQSLRPRKGALVTRPVGARVGESRRTSGGEGGREMARSAVLPLQFVLAAAPAAAQVFEHQTVTATISGLFLRADTSVSEQKVFDLLALPTQEIWYTIPGEWYALSATLTDTLEPSVARVTLVAPDDTVVADESADPPVYSLTAEGDWQSPAQQDGYLMADSRFEPTFEFGVTIDSTGAPKPFVKLEFKLVAVPAAEAGTVVILVLDGDAAPVPLAEVKLYRVEGETQTLHEGWPTSILGKATFTGVPPGRYVVDVHKAEYCHVRTTVPFELSPKEAAEGTVPIVLHHRIKGEIRFIDGNKQPTTGSIGQVEVELLRGDDTIAEASESGPDAQGKYDYTFPCPPAPGSYTVRGTYKGGEEKTGQVTVNDDCSALWRQSTLAAMAPGAIGGAHSEVQGPVLVFTEQME